MEIKQEAHSDSLTSSRKLYDRHKVIAPTSVCYTVNIKRAVPQSQPHTVDPM